ncbi:MAG: hypothetical protein MR512_05490 [Anaerococcus sp.]|nr:hypothetical protein [Anaerococcus sp.]
MNVSYFINYIGNLITYNKDLWIPITFILGILVFFIISRAFRKSGIFFLAGVFGIDQLIKFLPYDIYGFYPEVKSTINILYILGFAIFIFKSLKILSNLSYSKHRHRSGNKAKGFLSYTGSLPFIIMFIINIVDINNLMPGDLKKFLTSLAFLYMLFRSFLSAYRYLDKKDIPLVRDKMNFDDIDEYLREDKKEVSDKNKGRRIKKTLDDDIKIYRGLDKNDLTVPISDVNDAQTKIYKIDERIEKLEKEYSLVDIIDLVTAEDADNSITLRLSELSTGETSSYTTTNAKFKMVEEREYKVDLEFRHNNEYDYGRFIDILIKYSKNKESYKFELIVAPKSLPNSKIVFYDPSNIFDMEEDQYQNIGGRIISMNFPKYKINFITGN